MVKILIVEDEKSISDLLQMVLSDEGYHCVTVFDGETAAYKIEEEVFDLIILDVMLPKIDGYELLEYVNGFGIPVIFLTAKSSVEDKVKGLNLGAEDYMTKPFEVAELVARIERVLRRYNKASKKIRFKDIEVDIEARVVTKGGVPVLLTAKEFDLFLMFLRNKNKALYRSSLYAQVWGDYYDGDTRTVDLHVQRMRKKLKLEDIIVPVYKIGYKLEDDA